MSDLSAFPITKRWPAKHPELLQLYSLPTPNGVKVSIMLEEIGLPYEVHLVDFGKDDQETPEFLHFQMGGIGPMFGQVGFFHKFAGKDFEDKRPLERYVGESKRLLGVMETHLSSRQWFMDDDYTIADISMLGWVRNLIGFYGAGDLVAFGQFKSVAAWLERGLARPAVQRGLNIPKRP